MQLTPGANAPLPTAEISVSVKTGKAADVSAFRLYAGGKTKKDSDFVFYGQKINDDSTVKLVSQGLDTVFNVDLVRMKNDVQRLAFSATVDTGTISNLGTVSISVAQGVNILVQAEVPMAGRTESALILGELYRRNNEWKFRFVSQGFNGGLAPLAEHFGVDIASDNSHSTPSPSSSSAKSISLSKITLTKSNPTISLEKRDSSYGMMKVNLNWNQKSTGGGLFSFFKSNAIDLDLGAFVKLKNGNKHVIQALGEGFGSYTYEPFVELQGDDRTGAVSDGEWLHINGSKWAEIDEVLIFTFIYEGVPNWAETDGVVTLHMPNQPPVETKLTEGNNQGMCAIARLVNVSGVLKVERINQYFKGHSCMDEAFGWGFRWVRGSK
ncbi:TerD family protein [Endozoicomonas euniceicola]|uniref:TerD family protein n=1 Tax=Endozoicomonas euniceicola TaxID=1234143 RepID=A0ABY6H1B9_9GAMM|nr:TerD family protein [Endozoicomonas euniceicola]